MADKEDRPIANTPSAGPSAEAKSKRPATPTTSSPYEQLSPNEEANAQARLNKKERDSEAAEADYHQRLVEKDQRIEELEALTVKWKKYGTNAMKEVTTLRAEKEREGNSWNKSDQDIKKLQKELDRQKELSKYDYEKAAKYEQEIEYMRKEVVENRKVKVKAENATKGLRNELDQANKELKLLDTKLYHLTQTKDLLQEARDIAVDDVESANREFEEIFKDLPGLDLPKYMEHLRKEFAANNLRRQSSNTSLQTEEQSQRGGNRNVSRQSLQDQLDDAGYRSSTDGGQEDDDEHDDDTLRKELLGLVPDKGEDDESSTQASSANAAVAQEVLTISGPITIAEIVPSPTTIIADIVPSPSTQTLIISGPNTVAETVPSPTITVAETVLLPTTTLPQPTLAEIWQMLPHWLKLVFFMMLMTYIYIFSGLVQERHMWLAANDLTRQNVVRLGAAQESTLLTPLFSRLDSWIGVDYALLG
ncbi:hypothetical protein LTR37_005707 [Vermiconidia calcicola]|uniref:Uncharacterized protein n=1 Tax=Vermiconidia calcicola TaxID=1690605 RepID=A0ACC3NIS3_9PEZI|nr:hypothetical protein LTR37_005707 [Vermiconidia calcicola]